MNELFKWINIAGSLLPLVQSVVQLFEVFPNLTGPQKKDYALNLIESIFNMIKTNPNIKIKELNDIDFASIKFFVGMLIDTIVGVFNVTGTFKKENPA